MEDEIKKSLNLLFEQNYQAIQIKEFPFYAITRCAKVFSLVKYDINKRKYISSVKEKSKAIHKTNCHVVNLYTGDRNYKTVRVHRLVGKAFIENPLSKPEINHINGNRLNNRIENLEWVTGSENLIHSYRVLKRKPIRMSSDIHPMSRRVFAKNTNSEEDLFFYSMKDACNAGVITKFKIRKYANTGVEINGYIWQVK